MNGTTDNVKTATRALACLDLTELGDGCTPQAAASLVARAQTPYGCVAAVCLWPQFVSQTAARLRGSGVRLATVINFPAGDEDIERAIEDTAEAIRDGADEIDLVIPYKALMRGDERVVRDMIGAVRDQIFGARRLKAILETGELRQGDLIRRAGEIAIAAGAHFLKTSTGKTTISATPEAARVMLETIRASGVKIGFKASGGVRTLADAALYLRLADDIMGPDWASPATFRFGASGLLDALLEALGDARPSGDNG